MEKLHVDYAQYHNLIDQVVCAVEGSGFQPDVVLGVSRGGLFLADGLSRALRKPMAVIAASSYRGGAGTEQGELQVSASIASVVPVTGKVLLVDDLADSGHTLHAVLDLLRNNYKPITEMRSAVIWTKGLSKFTPDYSVEFLPTNPWIHQPFEAYDSMRPEKLLDKWRV